MNNSPINLKEALTKVVVKSVTESKGRKSTGVKIAVINRDIPIVKIAPFSF